MLSYYQNNKNKPDHTRNNGLPIHQTGNPTCKWASKGDTALQKCSCLQTR
jgi:hypothetical protein